MSWSWLTFRKACNIIIRFQFLASLITHRHQNTTLRDSGKNYSTQTQRHCKDWKAKLVFKTSPTHSKINDNGNTLLIPVEIAPYLNTPIIKSCKYPNYSSTENKWKKTPLIKLKHAWLCFTSFLKYKPPYSYKLIIDHLSVRLTPNGSAFSHETADPQLAGRSFSGRDSGTATIIKNTSKRATAVAIHITTVSLYRSCR